MALRSRVSFVTRYAITCPNSTTFENESSGLGRRQLRFMKAFAVVVGLLAGLMAIPSAQVGADVVPGYNGRIAFWYQSSQTDCQSLASVSATGTDFQLLVDCNDPNQPVVSVGHVSWSPDGSEIMIAAQSRVTNNYALWRVSSSGGIPTEVLVDSGSGPQPACEVWNLDWVTTSTVALISSCNQQSNFGVLDLTTGMVTWTSIPSDCIWTLNVAGDNTTVVAQKGDKTSFCTFSMNSPATQTTINHAGQHASWVPNASTEIVYADTQIGIVRLDLITDTSTTLVAGTGKRFPQVSPDGTKLSYLNVPQSNPNQGRLIIANADGTNPLDVFTALGVPLYRMGSPKWHSSQSAPTPTPTPTPDQPIGPAYTG